MSDISQKAAAPLQQIEEDVVRSWPGLEWQNVNDCENWLLFCGWPHDAVKAVLRSYDFCITNKCLDTSRTGSKAFQQPYPCFFWVNLPLCCAMVCSSCFTRSVKIRNLQAMTGTTFCGQCVADLATTTFCLAPCYYASVRAEFRKKYDLAGSSCEDFFTVCCFGSCVLCQDANQLQVETGKKIPFAQFGGNSAPPAVKQAPPSQEPQAE